MTHEHDGRQLSLGAAQEVVAKALPNRVAIRWRSEDLTYERLMTRTRSLAAALHGWGLGVEVPRAELGRTDAGQSFVGVLMRNRPEYLEALFGAFKSRCAPFNMNYRYSATEIRELNEIARPRVIIYEPRFAEVLALSLADVEPRPTLIEVGGDQSVAIDGALSYENLLADHPPDKAPADATPDDLYVVVTGGTTGRPKAVLWRQGDALEVLLGGPPRADGDDRPYGELLAESLSPKARRALAASPFMHGGGQWVALTALLAGDTLVIQDEIERLDPADLLGTVERERVGLLMITGNAYAMPILSELEQRKYDLSSLRIILTGAVAMTQEVKDRLLATCPQVKIVDTLGATESGTHLRNVSAKGSRAESRRFQPSSDTVIVNEDRTGLVTETGTTGWLARSGRVPLGYFHDVDRTNSTFPEIDGVRYSIPGDRARWVTASEIEFLGRDAVTINTGGEKVFAEEVEAALMGHHDVLDAVVTARDHSRWGQEIVALVVLRDGSAFVPPDLKDGLASRLARFKLPKEIRAVSAIKRSDVGKVDYAWARQQFVEQVGGQPSAPA